MSTAGHSGTPLARKLSLEDGQRVWWHRVPESVQAEIAREGLVIRHPAGITTLLRTLRIIATSDDHDRLRL